MPEVSVIIPTFNRAYLLKAAVESVLAQTYQDFEIIVIDDGSTDNTKAVVERLVNDKIRYIFQENHGVSSAYNNGIRSAAGRLIAFLDSDDLWVPDKLELQIKALEFSPWAAVVYSDISYFGAIDDTTPKTYFQLLKGPPPRGQVLEKLIEHCFPQTSTLLIKRDVFDQSGLYDEKINHCEDYDLLFRIAEHFQFEVVPLPLSMYRLHDIHLSSDSERMLSGSIYFLNKAVRSKNIDCNYLKKLRSRLARNYFEYGITLIHRGKLRQGLKEIMVSIKTDALLSCYLSAILAKHFINHLFGVIEQNTGIKRARIPSYLSGSK